jgi:hypothetical protein
VKVVAGDRKRKILDFDIENRPQSYWYDGNPTAQITAIAWAWVGGDHVEVAVRTKENLVSDLLEEFYAAYVAADLVTGHYIRRHDLPILNGALVENDMTPLPSKLTQDTKLDLVKYGGIPATQEFLGVMMGLEYDKVPMTQNDWRLANDLSDEGIARTESRVVGDVKQHMELREALIARRLLKAPSMWYSVPGGKTYVEV